MQATSDARLLRRFAAPVIFVLATCASADRPRAQGIQGEGPLGNDAFLPVSASAAKDLAAGDEAFSKKGGEVAAIRAAAFEAWLRALSVAENGDCASRSDRATESIDSAVRRRVRAAGDEATSAWRSRFDAVAASALGAAGSDATALERVARGFPLTRAAARAELALADLAHESGETLVAATWLDRARADGDPKDTELGAAIARRAAASASPASTDLEPSWRHASHLTLESQIVLEGSATGRTGIAPGIALLPGGRVCVQCAENVHFVAPDGRVRSVDLGEMTRAHGWTWLPPFVDRGERWPLLPATDGASDGRIVVVAGRAAATRGNALLAIDASQARSEPALAWGYSDAGFLGEDGNTLKNEELIGPGLWEFEPGPLVVGGTVLVQAHQWTSEGGEPASVDERAVRAWCLALDLESGRPRWKRLLAVGASGKGRLQGARGFAHPAQPLALLGGQALVGTGIGVGARVDLCDGRVVAAWKFRRAPEGSGRWSLGPPLVGTGITWAPPDSDRMYFLRRDVGGIDGVPGPLGVREIGDDVAPIAACGGDLILLSRADGRTTVARLAPASGGRVDSVELPTGERFAPCGLACESRVVVAGDRAAYLFDLERDVGLLDLAPLPGREEGPEGAIAARGDRIYIAGERRLWILKVR